MFELAFEESSALVMQGGSGGPVVSMDGFYQASDYQDSTYQESEYPPVTQEEFIDEVEETLAGTGGILSVDDLALIPEAEWENFLSALLAFVNGTPSHGGSDQNSYYNDHSNEAPLGEFFIEQWGFLPSVQRMPGYHYYDYLTQDIDPEFLEMAYASFLGASVFANSDLSLADIENMPFQMVVDGRPISITWHSGSAPGANFSTLASDPDTIVVTASTGYFTIDTQPPGPSQGNPNAMDFVQPTLENMQNGSLRAVQQAISYLDDNELARQILASAVLRGVRVVVVTGTAEHGEANGTVFWNPTAAVRLTNGGIMSPAMCLLHELAHAVFGLPNTPTGDAYGNIEDRYIIQQVENVVAAALGEPTRQDHDGDYVFGQTDVTFHQPPPDLGDFRI
ncbi:MAG TPA: hypothetical protein VMG08_17610 [Allosphingosinicella sp.]|nr:hypothetical protein [Allosphingosinicella sp.]